MPVRVRLGITQFGGDPVFESLRYEVFQPLGLLVYFIPRIAEEFMQELFQQAMVAQYFQSPALAGRRQPHTTMFFVPYEGGALRGELLEHARYRGRAHSQMRGQGVTGDAILLRTAQLQNRLQIVIDRL